jgi:hypothetical protein
MKIFAGGSSPVSGITFAVPQLSVGFCATAVTAHKVKAVSDSIVARRIAALVLRNFVEVFIMVPFDVQAAAPS